MKILKRLAEKGALWLAFGTIFIGELTLRLVTCPAFFAAGLAYSLAFGAAAAILLFLLCCCGSPRLNRIIAYTLCGIITVIYAAQLIYYSVFQTYFTVFSAANGGQVIEFADVIFSTLWQRLPYILLLLMPLACVAILDIKKVLVFPKAGWRLRLCAIGAALLCQTLTVAALPLCGKAQNSPYQLYFHTRVINESVYRLGLFTTMRHDCSDLIFGFEETVDEVDTEHITIEPSGGQPDDKQPDTPSPAPPTATTPRTPQVLDLDFAAMAQQTNNREWQDIDNYLASVPPTYTNEFTGMFKGKNLIFIVAESFSPYVIDAVRTPTLYKMQRDGFQFTNYYTGLWGVSTSDGEYTALCGMIPKQNIWSLYDSSAQPMPFTIASELKAEGYSTYGFHNGLFDYYGRNISHPHLGYDTWLGVGNGLDMPEQWPRSDRDLVDITTDYYLQQNSPFHVYYLTISGHLPYNFNGDEMAMKNKDAVQGLPYSEPVKAYLAANIELDKAMELLLQRLSEAGQLDDTVIVLCADHYPYGLTKDQMDEMAGRPLDSFELYKNTLLIYNHGTNPQVVAKPCSSIDVLPTLNNLFGVSYDSRLYSGRDIFSDSPALVPFLNRSFITDAVRYDAVRNTAYAAADKEVTTEYIAQTSEEMNKRFVFASKMLSSRYNRHVWEVLSPADDAA